MKIIRKTSVLIKTARKFIVHQASSDEQICCEQCGGQMITTHQCAVLNGISSRAVYRLVERGDIRFIETDSRIVFVCPICGGGNYTEFSNSVGSD